MGGYAAQQAVGLKGRHDQGSVYLSDDFQNELDFLGVESSPSFVRQPQGNGCIHNPAITVKVRACCRQVTTMAVRLRVKTPLSQVLFADDYLRNDEVERWKLIALEPADGYVAALCGAGVDWRMRGWCWRP